MALNKTKNHRPNCHPTYKEMIKDAIVTLKKRSGSSQYAIAKFMEEKHKDLQLGFRKYLLSNLKRLVACEKLVKVKGSFKLPLAKSYGPKKKGESPKPKPNPKSLSKPKPKETKTTKSNVKAHPNTNAIAKSEGPFSPKVAMINAMPFVFIRPYRKRQTKPKPKPTLKAKETKTTKSTTKAKPKLKSATKSKGVARPKDDVTKPKTIVKTKPSAKVEVPKKGPVKAASTMRRSPRIQALAPKSVPKKATPKKNAPAKDMKPKSVKPSLRMNAMM